MEKCHGLKWPTPPDYRSRGGIGAAKARACAAWGAEALVLADAVPLNDIHDEPRELDIAVTTHHCDLSRCRDNAELAAAGDPDAAAACAGICPLQEDWLDDPDWDEVFSGSWR